MKRIGDTEFFPIGSTCEVRLDGLRAKKGSFLNEAMITASLEQLSPHREIIVPKINFKYVPKSRGVYIAEFNVPDIEEETSCGLNILIIHNFKKMRIKMRRPARILNT